MQDKIEKQIFTRNNILNNLQRLSTKKTTWTKKLNSKKQNK